MAVNDPIPYEKTDKRMKKLEGELLCNVWMLPEDLGRDCARNHKYIR